jgi:chromosome segregation ATPase
MSKKKSKKHHDEHMKATQHLHDIYAMCLTSFNGKNPDHREIIEEKILTLTEKFDDLATSLSEKDDEIDSLNAKIAEISLENAIQKHEYNKLLEGKHELLRKSDGHMRQTTDARQEENVQMESLVTELKIGLNALRNILEDKDQSIEF